MSENIEKKPVQNLAFDAGIVSYKTENGTVIEFAPTDPLFWTAMAAACDKIEGHLQRYHAALSKASGAQLYKQLVDINNDLLKVVDDLFGEAGVGAKIFRAGNRTVSCYTLVRGVPNICNLIMLISDVMHDALDDEVVHQVPKAMERVDSYVAKYERQQRTWAEKREQYEQR